MPQDVIANKYKIVREIARSNDVVYEAIDTTMGRRLAVKELVIAPNLTGQAKRERIERFHREARASGKLAHPNIVTVYDYGQDNDRYFIAMEYLEGSTLRDLLQTRGALPVQEAVEIACQVLSALSHAHQHQVIHRDVKPDNMHILPGGQVKLTDFGIARLSEEASLTGEGQVFGTPSYMSPEQIKGQFIDHRTDLFSLGIVLYEMLAGRKPFTGDSVISITYSIMENAPPPLPGLPYGIERALFRALDKQPGRRFASAEEMRAELKNADAVPSMFFPPSGQTGMGGLGAGPAGSYGGGLAGGFGAPSSYGSGGSFGNAGNPSPFGSPGGLPGGTFPSPGSQAPIGSFPGGPVPTYGSGHTGTVYSPPPASAPPTQGGQSAGPGGPFVNWNPNSPNLPSGYTPPPPPFPRQSAGPVMSEGAKTFFKALILALVLGGAVLGGVLLFMNAFAQQQKNGAAAAVMSIVASGRQKLDAGDYAGAVPIFQEAYKRGIGTPAGDTARDGLVIAYNHLGLNAYQLKDYKTARDYWFRALDLDPNNDTVNDNLKHLYDRIGSRDEALEDWRTNRDGRAGDRGASAPGNDAGLQARYEEAQALFKAGADALKKGDFDGARQDWQRVIEKAPGTDISRQAQEMMNKINESQTGSSPYLGG